MYHMMNRSQIRLVLFISIISLTSFYGCTKSTPEINAKDFGAVPDDNKDDTPAILSAIEACKNKKNSKLVFESGSYDIYGKEKNERGNFGAVN